MANANLSQLKPWRSRKVKMPSDFSPAQHGLAGIRWSPPGKRAYLSIDVDEIPMI
jgi:hypothetical protein